MHFSSLNCLYNVTFHSRQDFHNTQNSLDLSFFRFNPGKNCPTSFLEAFEIFFRVQPFSTKDYLFRSHSLNLFLNCLMLQIFSHFYMSSIRSLTHGGDPLGGQFYKSLFPYSIQSCSDMSLMASGNKLNIE